MIIHFIIQRKGKKCMEMGKMKKKKKMKKKNKEFINGRIKARSACDQIGR